LEVVLLTFLRSSSLGLLLKDGEERMTAGEWLCQRNASRDDQLLACGALIVAELRAAVLQETQFTCSAGIAHNKMLAKLTSSMHKPAQQTVVPSSYVPALLASLPIKKM
jgi:DNA polymerase eta